MALGRTHPAAGRQHHGDRLVREQLGLLDRLRGGALDDAGAPLVAVFLGVGLDLVAHQLAQPGTAGEDGLELRALLGQLALLLADLHLLELGQMAQLGLQDRLGLLIRQLEALDQHRLGLFLAPDDADHLVQIQIDDQQAVEDVQPPRDTLSSRCCSRRRTVVLAELEPLGQQRLQPHDARPAVVPITLRLTR